MKSVKKAGSFRKLRSITGISLGRLCEYRDEKCNLPRFRAEMLSKLCGLDFKTIMKNDVLEILPENWGKIKGGIKWVRIRRKRGILKESMQHLIEDSSKRMKRWHTFMKKNNPQKYYAMQNDSFKKSRFFYKYKTLKREKVRNILEKQIADYLYNNGINYEYEPRLKIGDKSFFPDFKINKIILEATFWRGKQRIPHLKNKLKAYSRKGFYPYVIVLPKVLKFYTSLKNKVLVFEDINKLNFKP